MCEPLDVLSIEILDSRDVPAEEMQPVIDAAFAADRATSCCLQRKNAVSHAVFETARGLGYDVAWGDILDPEAPAFYLWPTDTWRTTFIRNYLDDHHANQIRAKDLR